MKRNFLPVGVSLAIMISYQTAVSQNCKCSNSPSDAVPIFVPETTSREYMGYYESNYRSGTQENFQKHSVSVDFSKTAFLDFYTTYGGASTQYDGVAFNFISFNNYNGRDGQIHLKQISLILSPATCDGNKITPQYTNYMIRNNSYNRDLGNYKYDQRTFKVTSSQAPTFITRYEGNYHTSSHNKNKYTKFLFLDKDVITVINTLLIQQSHKYAGIRIFFASYNKNVVCSQADDTQITLLIAPVLTSGEADFSVFNNSSAWKPEVWNKLKDFNTVNHGALCPNNCN